MTHNHFKYCMGRVQEFLLEAVDDGTAEGAHKALLDILSEQHLYFQSQADKYLELIDLLGGVTRETEERVKVTQEKNPGGWYQEMLDLGYEMTADGMWVKKPVCHTFTLWDDSLGPVEPEQEEEIDYDSWSAWTAHKDDSYEEEKLWEKSYYRIDDC